MRRSCLLLSLLACTLAPRDPTGPSAADVLASAGASGPLGPGSRAARLDPVAAWSPIAPPSPALPETVALSGWTETDDAEALRLGLRFEARLPAPIPGPTRRFAPPGASVSDGDRPLPWHFGGPGPGWRVHGDRVLLAWPGEPPPTLVWRAPGLAQELARLDPEGARVVGGAADAVDPSWAAGWWSVGHDRRRGVFVPAGGAVTLSDAPVGSALRTAIVAPRGGSVTVTLVGPDGPFASREAADGAFDPWDVPLPGGPLTVVAAGAPGALAFLAHPIAVSAPRDPPRRIVWIGLDTTRPDHLGFGGANPSPSPALDALASRAVVFSDAVAPAPRTRPSFRAALTGRAPLDRVAGPDVFDALGRAGFVTAGIVANPHLDPALSFGARADAWRVDPDQTADIQVDRAIAWLEGHRDCDAALFLHLMDPHLPYAAPEPWFERFADPAPSDLPPRLSRRDVFERVAAGQLTDADRRRLNARYRGEIAFMDSQIARLLLAIEALPGPTLLVVHSDHGEEFWEHGGFEHNHALTPEVLDAVLMIRLPGQRAGAVVGDPVSLEEIAPTVLEIAGVSGAAMTGRTLTAALRGAPLSPRPLGVGHLMYGTERWGVRAMGQTYILHTASGVEELYDRTHDPEERRDMARFVSLDAHRAALAEAHGMDVGPGWRVGIGLDVPVAIDLPAKARAAGVIDPEAHRTHRANTVWGIPAPSSADDVASVALSDDGRRLTISPGTAGSGIVWVRFEEAVAVGGEVTAGGRRYPLTPGPFKRRGVGALEVTPGTIALPPRDEAAQLADGPALPPDHLEALRALGYLDSE